MFAQYSPLFTSGLLSDSSPSSSRSPSPKRRFRSKSKSISRSKKATHESLPVTVSSASFSVYAPHAPTRGSSDSAFFLTLKPSRRDEDHSFLSLDLADTHRTMSLRRKDTTSSKATSFFGRSEPASPLSPLPKSSTNRLAHAHASSPSTSSAATVIPRVPTPVLRRSSRETLRLPSPKPAPSTSLPDLPTAPAASSSTHKHRPSHLALTFSSCLPDLDLEHDYDPALPTPSTPHHRPTHSAPALMTPASASLAAESYAYFGAAPPTPPPTATRPDSCVMPPPLSAPALGGLRVSPSVRSTASVATRQRNRSAALAALEGRGSPSGSSSGGSGRRRRAPSVVKRNFMSMSDDEDEGDENDEEEPSEPSLAVLREEPPLHVSAASSASPSRTQSRRASKRASTSSDVKRSRRSTIESFFAPLTNFMDLRDDRERDTVRDEGTGARGWRSFVELSP